MRTKVRLIAIVLLVLAAVSLLSVYSYGRFAERVQGPPSTALPADRVDTTVDRAIAPLTQAHPDATGLALINDNLDAYAIRALTARGAGRSLDLQYYIWKPDITGALLIHELLMAAERGVRVRLLLDDLNAHDKDSLLVALDHHPNVEVRLFNPSRGRANSLGRGMEMLLRGVSLNRRMHNKAWIADNRVAVVGGRNVGDEYFGAAADTNFFDADLTAVGPAVAETSAIFDAFWNSRSAIPLEALVTTDDVSLERLRRMGERHYASDYAAPYLKRLAESPTVQALLQGQRELHWTRDAHVYSDPPEKAEGGGRDTWLMRRLEPLMAQARQRMDIISPYFVPGDDGVRGLVSLRQRGVAVSVLTNSLAATDVSAVHGGYAPYRKPLLEGGVALFELMPRGTQERSLFGSSDASLHTKAVLVDEDRGFVGSMNLDPRSVNLNTEMGIVFRDRALTADLAKMFQAKAGPKNSYRVELEQGKLRWIDGSKQPPRTWTHEPEASFGRRATARVIGWLPLESQL